MKVNRQIQSRYVKPNHLEMCGIKVWTEDGMYFRNLYHLLAKLKVVNYKKVIETLNANQQAR